MSLYSAEYTFPILFCVILSCVVRWTATSHSLPKQSYQLSERINIFHNFKYTNVDTELEMHLSENVLMRLHIFKACCR
jgi:hypothetical protein